MPRFKKISLLILITHMAIIGSVKAEGIPLVINELMASNSSSIRDPQGHYEDWIEIYNAGADAINMAGMYLTDNTSIPTKWRIPDNSPEETMISAGGITHGMHMV